MRRRHFHFKLEPVRDVRRQSERLAMKALALELAEASELHLRLGAAEERLLAAQHQTGPGGLAADELAQRQLYTERMERELEDARLRAAAQEPLVQEARDQLDHASRRREALDRLEDRRRNEHWHELDRAERVAADEIAAKMRATGLGGLE